MVEAVRDGKLVIPMRRQFPLSKAADARAAAEKGGIGKVLLLVGFPERNVDGTLDESSSAYRFSC